MIVFDLRCSDGHVFEAWFGSSRDFEDQQARGLLSCPMCGDGDIGKAVMAPAVAAKGNRQATDPRTVKAAMQALAAAQAKALEGSTWVGGKFADTARAMHLGEQPHRTIHGQATMEQAKALADEGVSVAPLPFAVAPPETLN